MRKELGLYVHIPFCARKCFYCAFSSFCFKDSLREKIKKYLLCLENEMKNRSEYFKDYEINTIYVGGGTPNILSAEEINFLFKCINKYFKVKKGIEITAEINPELFDRENLSSFVQNGVNRFSIGVQSLNENILKTINRKTRLEDVKNCVDFLHEKNIFNLSFDLMVGISNQTKKDIERDFFELLKFSPLHFSVYSLILEENTMLKRMVDRENVTLPTDEEVVEQFDFLRDLLIKNGFNRYEVSAFSKENMESEHNKKYWSRKDYLGLGLSAHSCISNVRFYNTNRLSDYFDGNILVDKEELSKEDILEETLMLGLRTRWGVNLEKIKTSFDYDILKEKKEEVETFLNLGLIELVDNCLIVTNKGLDVLNKIIFELLPL